MIAMQHRLDAWQEAAAARKRVWGQWDCCLLAADWIERETGVNPAVDLIGTYRTAAEAEDMIDAAGGFIRMVGPRLTRVGWRRRWLGRARPGDVGAVLSFRKSGPDAVGAVCLGDGFWATCTRFGLLVGKPTPLVAWKNPHG